MRRTPILNSRCLESGGWEYCRWMKTLTLLEFPNVFNSLLQCFIERDRSKHFTLYWKQKRYEKRMTCEGNLAWSEEFSTVSKWHLPVDSRSRSNCCHRVFFFTRVLCKTLSRLVVSNNALSYLVELHLKAPTERSTNDRHTTLIFIGLNAIIQRLCLWPQRKIESDQLVHG